MEVPIQTDAIGSLPLHPPLNFSLAAGRTSPLNREAAAIAAGAVSTPTERKVFTASSPPPASVSSLSLPPGWPSRVGRRGRRQLR